MRATEHGPGYAFLDEHLDLTEKCKSRFFEFGHECGARPRHSTTEAGRLPKPFSGSVPSSRLTASASAFWETLDRFRRARLAASKTPLSMYRHVDVLLLMIPYASTWHYARPAIYRLPRKGCALSLELT